MNECWRQLFPKGASLVPGSQDNERFDNLFDHFDIRSNFEYSMLCRSKYRAKMLSVVLFVVYLMFQWVMVIFFSPNWSPNFFFFRFFFLQKCSNIFEQTFFFFSKVFKFKGPVPRNDKQIPPLSFDPTFMKDGQCAESNEKSIFRFLFFELWLIVFTVYGCHTWIFKCVTDRK